VKDDDWALVFPEIYAWQKKNIISKKKALQLIEQSGVVIPPLNRYHYDMTDTARGKTTAMLASIEALTDSIRRELAKAEFDTSLLNYLRQRLQGVTINAGRGATFTVAYVVIYNRVELRVTGKMTYGGPTYIEPRTDNSAIVTVRRDGTAWTASSTWSASGSKHIEMPSGARSRVAEQVKMLVAQALPSDHYWTTLMREAEAEAQEATVRHTIVQAETALTNALAALTKHNENP